MKKLGLILSLILIFTVFAKADIPPDPGFKRVSVDLNIEIKEDLSDYRFFLDFYGDLREVEVKKGSNSIPSMGGGRCAGRVLVRRSRHLQWHGAFFHHRSTAHW